MKKGFSVHFFSFLLVLLVAAVYWPITKTFYQQDEWLGYGLFLTKGTGFILQNVGGFWGVLLGQGRVLTNLLYFIFYKYFPLNAYPMAIFAIMLHAVNVLIVFFLARKLFKKDLSAFLGSLFFAVSSVSSSAVTWAAASVNTLPSTTLILAALIFYFYYLEKENAGWLFYCFLAIYMSLFFKETGIFLFLLLPLSSLLFKKYSLKSYIGHFWYYFLVAVTIVTYRLVQFLLIPHPQVLFLTGSSKYFFDSLAIRAVLYPLTSFSLSIVPPDIFLNFARYITNVYYPFIPEGQFILVAQTVVLDLLATVLSMIIAFVSLALLKMTDIKIRKNMIFWFIFLLASFLPYIVISKSYSYLESRYYYLAAAAWGMIFAWIADLTIKKIKPNYIKYFLLGIFFSFIYIHVFTVKTDIQKLVMESQTRIGILNQIKEIKPKLEGKKNIFYVTGDSDYLLPGNKVPFQQGFGYTLMTLYFKDGKIPKEFLDEQYLFELGSQGYKEIGLYGFGYFWDRNLMRQFMETNGLSKNIIRLFYDSKKNSLIMD